MTRPALVTGCVLVAVLVCAPTAQAEWAWPVRGEVITAYRNGDDPYAAGQHRGIDIAAPVGTAVVAAARGEVRFAGVAGSSGLTVSVRTADGRFDSSYLHLSSASVHAGQLVAAGERLGAVGTSGRRSAEQPHLHFGVRDAGTRTYHDPLELLPPLATVPEPRPVARPPLPVPAPPAPAALRAPVPRRVPAARPRRLPASRRVPAREPRPAPARRRLPAAQGRRAPTSVPVGVRRALLDGAPHRLPTRDPADARRPQRLGGRSAPPVHGQRRAHGPRDALSSSGGASSGRRAEAPRSSEPSPAPRPDRDRARSGGPDVGWVLACLGLLAAAALVGTGGGGRTATRRGGAAIQRALHPLLGRR